MKHLRSRAGGRLQIVLSVWIAACVGATFDPKSARSTAPSTQTETRRLSDGTVTPKESQSEKGRGETPRVNDRGHFGRPYVPHRRRIPPEDGFVVWVVAIVIVFGTISLMLWLVVSTEAEVPEVPERPERPERPVRPHRHRYLDDRPSRSPFASYEAVTPKAPRTDERGDV